MMSLVHLEERPAKKRRFFVEDEDEAQLAGDGSAGENPDAFANSNRLQNAPVGEDVLIQEEKLTRDGPQNGEYFVPHASDRSRTPDIEKKTDDDQFDEQLFLTVIGQELPEETIERIRSASNDNMERAVNMFFDGSWKTFDRVQPKTVPPQSAPSIFPQEVVPAPETSQDLPELIPPHRQSSWKPVEGAKVLKSQPWKRYIGAFGVGAWATRSGNNLVQHGEKVGIERSRSQPTSKMGRGGKFVINQKGDVLTRFTNKRGEEIGRLPRETAEWVSTLIDQSVCVFEGVCVFAPDRIRVNDTIYLQLRCYLHIDAFRPGTARTSDDNRSTGLFEERESAEERDLRLRQVALVRLFDEINLLPTSTNETTAKHKKEGILRAAEMAEQYDKNKKDRSKEPGDSDNSSPEEESAELEEDQLDSLYKKAQSFDFSTPEVQPADTFAMDLRKYQKQALHWMLAKEKDSKSGREVSMHPLWEEYKWPVKDVDDQLLPCVYQQDYFYVNPYSGELTLVFPVQQQHCLGGILADEMGLGKTIEMLSLVHTHRITSKQQIAESPALSLTTGSSFSGVASAPYTTLVVAPTSLLSQWESEAYKASRNDSLRTIIYYGSDRSVNLKSLCSSGNPHSAPHLIITSYGVVLSEFRSFIHSALNSSYGLFSLEFFRIILDEAHLIKNRRSKTARACYELKSIHRWVLTGTPIVNRLEDLFSLIRFLKVEPWSNFSFWKTFITVPFESKDYVRALNVVQTVLEPLVLRRTKTMKTPDGEALVPLPARTITVEEVELPQQEREIYDYIFTRAKRTFTHNIEAGTLLKSFTTIFAQLLRLRQCCCHPILTRNKAIVAEEEDAAAAVDEASDMKDDMDLQELINRFTASTETAESDPQKDSMMRFSAHALRQIQSESSGECPICSEEPMIEPAVTGCWHSACKKCLEDYIRHQTDKGELPRCFSCRAPVTQRDIFEVVRHQSPGSSPEENDLYSSTPPVSTASAPRISLRRIYPLSPSAQTSAKIHSLINHLTRLQPGTKSVVFSQFTSFLDLIGPQLTKAGISYLRLDGTMPQKQRADVLRQFNKVETYEEEENLDAEDDIDDDGGIDHNHAKRSKSGLQLSQHPTASGSTQITLDGKPTTSSTKSTASPSVLLISLRAGGVGLNLTAANHVYMMDPWWSFAVEAQAIDRVHRMGQLRQVFVTRFVVKDSIEGRMLRVQERKMNIAGTLGLRVGGDASEDDRRKERIEELKLLFE